MPAYKQERLGKLTLAFGDITRLDGDATPRFVDDIAVPSRSQYVGFSRNARGFDSYPQYV